VSPDGNVVIEIYGEGKTDVGEATTKPQPPDRGVVPILVSTLCGRPAGMLVKRYGSVFLNGQKGSLSQKVRFAKQQACYNGSAAAVFVVDSEGGRGQLKKKTRDLTRSRDHRLPNFPMAVGVAQPCIEAWLLSDATAIRRGLELAETPRVPDEPEKLPAPCQDTKRNPKNVLVAAAGSSKKELSTKEKDQIARSMNDMNIPRQRCPEGFAPFADEVQQHIAPLFP